MWHERGGSLRRVPIWLLGISALLVCVNVVGAVGAISSAPLHSRVALPFSPIVPLAFSGGWALMFAALLVGFLRRRAWAFRWFGLLAALYALARFLLFVLLARSDYDQGRIGFQAAVTAVAVFTMLALGRLAQQQARVG